jgi:solute carrier family 35 protein F5
VLLAPLWFALNYTYNLSLDYTSLASSTILSNCSSLFVLFWSRLLLRTPIAGVHIAGVALTLLGVGVISYRDEQAQSGNGADTTDSSMQRSLVGDALAALSAAAYGLYTVTMRMKIPDESAVEMQLLFGCLGLVNMLTLWPLFPLLHATGFEHFTLPSGAAMGVLLLNGFFGSVISDFLWAHTVLLTSPLIATLGLALTIPLAVLADFVFAQRSFHPLYLLGSLAVVSGFLLVNWSYVRADGRGEGEADSAPSAVPAVPVQHAANGDPADGIEPAASPDTRMLRKSSYELLAVHEPSDEHK